ncbi:crossover junction endodeoxyribonuclease RuvC [Thiohalobacter sp. IOR34]|uniref:crossover junction endodeoxyribonuclease RuvC n=1 Tax=Thiohalobacter sp. IOR34 TaxID=3057176 RepID=UPI0025AFAE0D|nr:crossover junction endodeoxyribonuclease RuvC [Thiohalobacter sp. IOR34]WJW76848.1 crossover junction endodeoxyribonuclease RuvC [Thiohalobacter sp. IOR34]
MTRILGIDPGSQNTGFGIVDVEGSRQDHVHSGRLRIQADGLAQRLGIIFRGISELVEEWRPQEVAIERVFMSRNADSALKLGQARGAAICGVVAAGLPVAEYSPREIKLAVVGTGGADKVQVQHMVQMLLKLSDRPQADQADALAVALCHANTRASLLRVAAARGSRRGRYR